MYFVFLYLRSSCKLEHVKVDRVAILRGGFTPSILCHIQSFDIIASMVAYDIEACFIKRIDKN